MENCRICGKPTGLGRDICYDCEEKKFRKQFDATFDPTIILCKECNKPLGQGRNDCESCKHYYFTPQFQINIKGYSNAKLIKEYQECKGSDDDLIRELINKELQSRQLKIKPWPDQNYILLTTAPFVDGYKVTKTLEILSAESVQGMNIFRDLFAGVSDIVGGRSVTTQNALREARKTCLKELQNEAASINADAVIAIDLDYSEISGQGKSMLFLVASGTAVQLEKI